MIMRDARCEMQIATGTSFVWEPPHVASSRAELSNLHCRDGSFNIAAAKWKLSLLEGHTIRSVMNNKSEYDLRRQRSYLMFETLVSNRGVGTAQTLVGGLGC